MPRGDTAHVKQWRVALLFAIIVVGLYHYETGVRFLLKETASREPTAADGFGTPAMLSKEDELQHSVVDDEDDLARPPASIVADVDWRANWNVDDGRVRVAVYKGEGISLRSWQNVIKTVRCRSTHMKARAITSLANLTLQDFDVVVVPGGIASRVRNSYRRNGLSVAKLLRNFVREGGGYIGVCAGAYLAFYTDLTAFLAGAMSLGSGYFSGSVSQEFDSAPIPLENKVLARTPLFYAYGPMFRIDEYRSGARFANAKILLTLAPKGTFFVQRSGDKLVRRGTKRFNNRPILAMNDFGLGRVIVSTAHPETDVDASKGSSFAFTGDAAKCGSVSAAIFQNMVFLAARKESTVQGLPLAPAAESAPASLDGP